ncbi:MAG: DNA translocase FtsK [Candidatus Coatesbacteria bacterium]|nr:MAG: DNA translocase FtsK [Candidatus Coatesbacteria bacterium]
MPKKVKRKPTAKPKVKFQYWSQVFGGVLVVLGLVCAVSLVTYHPDDLNVSGGEIHNKLGWLGAFIASGLVIVLGKVALALPVFFGVWAYYQFRGGVTLERGLRLTAFAVGIFALTAFLAFTSPGADDGSVLRALNRGGAMGLMLRDYVAYLLGIWGGTAASLLVVILCVSYLAPFSVINMAKGTGSLIKRGFAATVDLFPEKGARKREEVYEPEVFDEEHTGDTEPVSVAEPTPEPPGTPEVRQPPRRRRSGAYKLPSVDLLDPGTKETPTVEKEWLLNIRELLDDTLENYGIDARVHQVHSPGPRVTRFELKLEGAEKVNAIRNVAQELAIALSVPNVNVTSTASRGTVSVDVPNPTPAMVALKDILTSRDYKRFAAPAVLPVPVGLRSDGKVLGADLTKMPHLLVAGTTGSGKSVFLNAIILSLILYKTPEEVQFIQIDPKRVDLAAFGTIPHRHRFAEIVTEVGDAVTVLKYLVRRMEGRYKLLGHAGVRNIDGYNELFSGPKGKKIAEDVFIDDEQGEPLPHIVVVIDELGDLMLQEARKVEESLIRLAQMARAVGIHLVVATQRPSVDVITGVIKANFPSRIAFKVSSKPDSRTILDRPGAENLLKDGDMMFLPVGASEPLRVQGAYVSDDEIARVVGFWATQEPAQPLVSLRDEDAAAVVGALEEPDDELYDEAVAIVVAAGQASQSMLQRKLRIGFARAGRLVDMMETRGVVGPAEGTKPRKVLIKPEDLNAGGG